MKYEMVQPFMDTIDDSGMGGGTVDTTAVQGTEPQGDAGQLDNTPANTAPSEFEIDGLGKVKIDDIREWKLGYMRQGDYTKKTQELAKQRAENKDALELFTYLRNNPQAAQSLANGDMSALSGTPVANKLSPVASQIDQMHYELASIKLDNQISSLKSRFPDFDEVTVLDEADKRGISDLEFVYKALKADKMNDMETRIRKQVESEILEKIRKNGLGTETIATSHDTPVQNGTHGLTPDEIAIAENMGIPLEQYAKYKT